MKNNIVNQLHPIDAEPVESKDIDISYPILSRYKLKEAIAEINRKDWDINSENQAIKYRKMMGAIFNTFKRKPRVFDNRDFYLPEIKFKHKVKW